MKWRFVELCLIAPLFLFVTCQDYKYSEKFCPNSWKKFGDSCYRIIKERVSWSQAEETCRAWNNGHLVSISNLEEQDFVKSMATTEGVGRPIWIGLRKNKYQWTDGTELRYEYWNSNQPRSYSSATAYVYLHKNGYWKWFDVQYAAQHYVPLCKMPKPPSGVCPDASYWMWSDYCYRLQPIMKSFGESESLCLDQGSHLASIHSEAEMTYLRSQLTRHASNNVWIGLRLETKPFEFKWSDPCLNDTSYTSWRYSYTNTPDVSNVGSVCARLDNTQQWKWSVIGCSNGGTTYYFCESAMLTYPINDAACPSQIANVNVTEDDELPENSEISCDLSVECLKQYMFPEVVILLVGVILAVEILLVILVLVTIWCIKKRCKPKKERKTSKPTVMFRKPSEEKPEHPFLKLNNELSYQHMNPEAGSDNVQPASNVPSGMDDNGAPSLPNKPKLNGARNVGVPVFPSVPKSNDYTEYKIPSYENEVNTKDEENYQDIDEYEELPFNDSADAYELPTK